MEYSFIDPNGVMGKNLNKLTESACALYEERVCEIALFAERSVAYIKQLIDADMSISDAITALKEDGVFSELGSIVAPECTRQCLNSFARDLSCNDKILFSYFLCDFIRKSGLPLNESDMLPCKALGEKFTYVKNTLSDEAYDVFSQEFEDPRIVYSQNVRDALRSVSEGSCDYCIVPFEEKGGARIIGIYAMIVSLDLKIAAVTPVFGPEGDADVKYALVGREFIPFEKSDDDDVYVEVAIPTESVFTVSDLLFVAEKFGLSVYRIGGVEYDESDFARARSLYVSLKSSGKDLVPLIAFLEMFVDDFSAIG